MIGSMELTEQNKRRAKQLERQNIDRLLALAHEAHKVGDWGKEMRVASVLSGKYMIEGEHSFALSESQE